MTYTVKSVMPTGKAHEKYGTEFYVQFDETEAAFPLWFKEVPLVGANIDGEIIAGKFKKIKKEYKAAQGSTPQGKKSTYKDNSDGMRQGMCFNNAANYVATLEFKNALTDSEWATTVFSYAQALYKMGDLNVALAGAQEAPSEDVENVQAVFAGAKPETKPTK